MSFSVTLRGTTSFDHNSQDMNTIRWKASWLRPPLLAAVIAVALQPLVAKPVARADPAISRIGVNSCDNTDEVRVVPGEVVTIEACFVRAGSAAQNERVVFSEDGPSPNDLIGTVTDPNGNARIVLSSSGPGISRVGACDVQGCVNPIEIRWRVNVDPIEEAEVPPSLRVEAIGRTAGDLKPLTFALGSLPSTEGFDCRKGPSTKPVAVPAFADVKDVASVRFAHPKNGSLSDAVRVGTGQDFLVGSVIFGRPSLMFVAMKQEKKAVDSDSAFPFQGHNRLLVLWTKGNIHFGKQELEFDGHEWVDVPPTFTVTLSGGGKQTFFSDKGSFGSTNAGAGTMVAGRCDSEGIAALTAQSRPAPRTRPRSSHTTVGIGVLVALGALALAVIRSSRPPGGGLLLDKPGGPAGRFERSDIRYDDLGRILSYVDIIEMPDGTTRTVRTRVQQEDLVVDVPQVLDVADWEDDIISVTRASMTVDDLGRITSYTEQASAPDGTSEASMVNNIVYDHYNHTLRFDRTTTSPDTRTKGAGLNGVNGQSRFEKYFLEFDDPPAEAPYPPKLASGETLNRRELLFDDEGHVSRYVSIIFTNGEGERRAEEFDVAVPLPYYALGTPFGGVPAFTSQPNKGLARARHVFTRWFRRHGCLATLEFVDESGTPVPGVVFHAGIARSKADRKGRSVLWILEKGNYVIALESSEVAEWSAPTAWLVVDDIPGKVFAKLVIPRSDQGSPKT